MDNTTTPPVARYGLIGWPVAHSVSPALQTAAFAAYGLAFRYELVPTAPGDLAATVARLIRDGFAGWNVTVPHKEEMAALVDELDPGAAQTRSVNTVRVVDGRTMGWSTDGPGLERALVEAYGLRIPHRRFLFLGSGGAARACAVYCAVHGASSVVLANRSGDRARAVATQIAAVAPACEVACLDIGDAAAVDAVAATADVVIQATSLGIHSGDALPVDPQRLRLGLPVYDMIYRPTPFQALAAARGCRVCDGRTMLLHQGALSFTLWTGLEPPLAAMRRAVDAALAGACPGPAGGLTGCLSCSPSSPSA
jgi:shikimate dehydrogenase